MIEKIKLLYNKILNIEEFDFISNSLTDSKMNWNYKGNGKIIKKEVKEIENMKEVYFYETINLDNGMVLNDKKMWKFYEKKIEFYRFRNNIYEKIFGFYIENNKIILEEKYICVPDNYYAELEIFDDNIMLIIKIIGQKKNEKIIYKYKIKKQKFVIFDRDGVINVEKLYLYKIEDFEYEKGILESLLELQKLGYKFIIITNQAGIAKGYYTEEDYLKLEKFIMDDLYEKSIVIEKTYYCPHHPDGKGKYGIKCDCRKPNTKNFLTAISEFNIDIKNSYMIGDRITDLIPAQKLGFNTVLVMTGYGKDNVDKLQNEGLNSIVVNNVYDFVKKYFLKNKI